MLTPTAAALVRARAAGWRRRSDAEFRARSCSMRARASSPGAPERVSVIVAVPFSLVLDRPVLIAGRRRRSSRDFAHDCRHRRIRRDRGAQQEGAAAVGERDVELRWLGSGAPSTSNPARGARTPVPGSLRPRSRRRGPRHRRRRSGRRRRRPRDRPRVRQRRPAPMPSPGRPTASRRGRRRSNPASRGWRRARTRRRRSRP